MSEWKQLVTSGSDASLNSMTASNSISLVSGIHDMCQILPQISNAGADIIFDGALGGRLYHTNDTNRSIKIKDHAVDGINIKSNSTSISLSDTLINLNGTRILTDSGNVCIGSTSPVTKLHVVHGSAPNNVPELGNPPSAASIGGTGFGTLFTTLNSGAGIIQQARTDGIGGAYDLLLQPKGGNVGIGTASPAANLHISAGTTGDATVIIEADTDNDGTENDNPSILFKQDGAAVQGQIGIEGNAGNTYSNSLSNSTYFGSVTDHPVQFVQNDSPVVTIDINQNVGIGTDSPADILSIMGGIYTTHLSGNDIKFTRQGTSYIRQTGNGGEIRFTTENSNGTETTNMTLDGPTGYVGIGTTSPGSKLSIKQSGDTAGGGIRLTEWDTGNGWDIYMNQNKDLRFTYNQSTTTGGWISDTSEPNAFNFTGQHRTFPTNGIADDYTSSIGYIVVADGTYTNFSGSVLGKPNINESLPNVSLSSVANDKTVFGVISNTEDNGTQRNYAQGVFVTVEPKEELDTRLIINSLGEGAIWVSNYSGSLENGDYITSSPLSGLGMKQDDDLLHNYTVAKITQDCNFRINSTKYDCVEFEYSGSTYRKAFVGCTYHCG
tara:strand:+ start:9490 stop:11310 length:1821 start_codon:yes stop_codon:yes gene_type:complete